MLATYDRMKWQEDPASERARSELQGSSKPEEVRALFPFMGKTKTRLAAYGIPEGSLLKYVQLRHTLGFYPISAVVGLADEQQWGTHPRVLYLSSQEVQVLEI